MNLSKPFIERPVMTTLLTLALVLVGLMAYRQLPVSDLPNVDYPVINVQAVLPGASPQVMAETVATPLERELMTIPGISVVHSTSVPGRTSLVLEFLPEKRMDSAAQDVEAALSRSAHALPSTMRTRPTYSKSNPSQEAILYLALTSPVMTLPDLFHYGSDMVSKRLSMIEGVAHSATYGPERQIEILMDPESMQLKAITVGELRQAVLQANPRLPSGQLTGDVRSLAIRTDSKLTTVEEYRQLIVKNTDAGFIRLGDVAEVVEGPDPDLTYARYIKGPINQPTVIVAVQKLPGANTVSVANAIHALLPRLQAELPHSVSVIPLFDRSESIKESIADVQFTLVAALILVVMTLYFYFGRAQDALIPALVLPLSVIGTFFVMQLLGFTLNNLTLLALTLALGFVVDDAIVVIENIVRHIEEGETPLQAAISGSKAISFTVLSMTLSLTASFIPLLFMNGVVGLVFREFAITLAVTVLVSGIISLTLTPMLASRFLARQNATGGSKIGDSFNAWSQRLYGRLLGPVLRYSKTTAFCGLLCIGGVLGLSRVLPLDFLPHNTIPYAFIGAQGPQGMAPREQIKSKKELDKILQADAGVTEFISWVYQDNAACFVKLDPSDGTTANRLQGELSKVPGVFSFAFQFPLLSLNIGTASDSRTQFQLRSTDYDELVLGTTKLTDKLRALPGFINVTNNLEASRPQVRIKVDRERAALLGISAEEVEMTLLNAYTKGSITSIETNKGNVEIVLGVREASQRDIHALNQLSIRSPRTGEPIPLAALASWTEEIGTNAVHHTNQLASSTIAFSLAPEISLQAAMKQVNEVAERVLPATTTGEFQGAAKAFNETFGNLGMLVLITFLAAYIILGILYESFVHPITILSTLPPAAIGGLCVLYITGLPLSLFSLIGMVLLVGIVKKNGIMMVDHAIELRRQSIELTASEAIHEACLVRFRPMMMTTFAAVMGALPIAIGIGMSGEMRSPLGYVIVGGLLLSQVITLFITPAVYICLDRLMDRRLRPAR